MTNRFLWISSLLFACSTSKAPATDTTPKPAPIAQTTEASPANEPTAKPRLVLGDVTIVMQVKTKKESGEGQLVVTSDGTVTAKVTSSTTGKPNKTKTTTGKITAAGELLNDQGKAQARIADDGTVSVLHEIEQRENGKLVKLESKWNDVGTLDDDGTFTSKKDGTKLSIGADGTLVGLPIQEMTFTVTAGPEQKRVALFVVISMLAGGKTISDASGPVSLPAKT
jgi:hypothetical protein